MNRFFKIYFLVSIAVFICLVVYAGVEKRTRTTTDYRFNLKAGDRIMVIDASVEKTYIRITPSTARVFDLKVEDGKVMTGILVKRKK